MNKVKVRIIAILAALVLLITGTVVIVVSCVGNKAKSFSVNKTYVENVESNDYSVYVNFYTDFSEDLLFDSAWIKFKSFGKDTAEVRIHVSATNSLTGKATTGYLGNYGFNSTMDNGSNFGRPYDATEDNVGKWINIATNQPGANGAGGNYSTAQYKYFIVSVRGECVIDEIVFLCSEKDSNEYKKATLKVQDAGVIKTTDITSSYLDAGTWLTKSEYVDTAKNLLDDQNSFDVKKVSYGELTGTDTASKENKRYGIYAN